MSPEPMGVRNFLPDDDGHARLSVRPAVRFACPAVRGQATGLHAGFFKSFEFNNLKTIFGLARGLHQNTCRNHPPLSETHHEIREPDAERPVRRLPAGLHPGAGRWRDLPASAGLSPPHDTTTGVPP